VTKKWLDQPPTIEPQVLKPWSHHKDSIFQGALLAKNINQYVMYFYCHTALSKCHVSFTTRDKVWF